MKKNPDDTPDDTPEGLMEEIKHLRGDRTFGKKLQDRSRRRKRFDNKKEFDRSRKKIPESQVSHPPDPVEPSDENGYTEKTELQTNKDELDQHLLIDPAAITSLVDAARISSRDNILEIGPGSGNITKELLDVCRKVRASLITIEIDTRFKALLEEIDRTGDITMYWGDAIELLPMVARKHKITKIVANIPFSILEPLLVGIHINRSIRSVALVVGKRYADRATADFKDEDTDSEPFSVTSLLSQARFKPNFIGDVPAESFNPRPRTGGAILTLEEKTGRDYLTALADWVVKKPNMTVRNLLRNMFADKYSNKTLRSLRYRDSQTALDEIDAAREERPSALENELGKIQISKLSNDQLRRLLNFIDLTMKKRKK